MSPVFRRKRNQATVHSALSVNVFDEHICSIYFRTEYKPQKLILILINAYAL